MQYLLVVSHSRSDQFEFIKKETHLTWKIMDDKIWRMLVKSTVIAKQLFKDFIVAKTVFKNLIVVLVCRINLLRIFNVKNITTLSVKSKE